MNDSAFAELLRLTRLAFDASDIKRQAEAQKTYWGYSICATRILPGATLIIGFNWGVGGKGAIYHAQQTQPTESFTVIRDKKELGSLARIVGRLNSYLPGAIENIGQSNFCFFRSPYARDISPRDMEICIPLFFRFLELAQPSRILCLSRQLLQFFQDRGFLASIKQKQITYAKGTKSTSITVAKGDLRVKDGAIQIYFLPHPMAHLKKKVLDDCWAFCFGAP